MQKKELIRFYNSVYSNNEKKHYTKLLFTNGIPDDIKEILKICNWSNKKVADIGCGTGQLAYLIAKKGGYVKAIDFSKSAINEANKKYRNPNLQYQCMDLTSLKGKYDVIVSSGAIEHMNDPYIALKQMKKLLSSNGSLIIVCPNWTNPRGYILLTLYHLFNAPITKADRHYLTPVEFIEWSKKLKMNLSWKTFDFEWGHGEKLIKDFSRRLPRVLKETNLITTNDAIDGFISWLKKHITVLNHKTRFSGAIGLYYFIKKNK
jgi:2-polyprenyl-3-methyl-5-hydroxy-6-metoxy-1,4-benzoquinol methylase